MEWRLPSNSGFPGNWRWRKFLGPAFVDVRKPHRQEDLRPDRIAGMRPATGGRCPSAKGRPLALTGNWCHPPMARVQGLAPSTYPWISGQMALALILGCCAVEFRQIVRAEAVVPGPEFDNNARDWWVVSGHERECSGWLTCNWRLTPI